MIGTVFSVLKLLALKARYGRRLMIKKIHQNISRDTEISVGRNALFYLGGINVGTNVHLVCEHGVMDIGVGVIFNRNCTVVCHKKIKIGDGCLFGPNVCIFDHDHVFGIDGVSLREFECSEIIIEDGCWFGAGAVVLRGTHVGKNSVIGAGTVVKGTIPPNSLVASSRETKVIPLSLIKSLRKTSDIKRQQQIKLKHGSRIWR
jgi:acetyltransferase-like isoleucine patch superfamily enzyme